MLKDYEIIEETINLNWTQIDFPFLIKDELVILGKDDKLHFSKLPDHNVFSHGS